MFDDILWIIRKYEKLVVPLAAALIATLVVYQVHTERGEGIEPVDHTKVFICWVAYFLVTFMGIGLWVKLSGRDRNTCPLDMVDIKVSPGIYYVESRRNLSNNFRKSLLEKSHSVDMLGWNLWVTWFEEPEISSVFKNKLEKREDEFRLRILLPRRESPAFKAFVCDREVIGKQTGTEDTEELLILRYNKTRTYLKKLLGDREPNILKLLENEVVFSGILRFDNVMIVTYYMSSLRGSGSPAIILHKAARAPEARWLFKKYAAEFESLWQVKRYLS